MTAMTSNGTLSRAALQARIDALPRVRLAHLPTPLDHCPRLGEALGGVDVWIKRDDLTGLAFGGNKTRQPGVPVRRHPGAGRRHRGRRRVHPVQLVPPDHRGGAQARAGGGVGAAARRKGPALRGQSAARSADGGRYGGRSRQHGAAHALARGEGRGAQRAGRRPYVVRPVRPRKLVLGAVGYVAARSSSTPNSRLPASRRISFV